MTSTIHLAVDTRCRPIARVTTAGHRHDSLAFEAVMAGIKIRRHGPGRYTDIAENMRVKKVKVSDTERFVICHNPDAATRDAHIRAQLLAHLDELIAGSDKLPVMKRGELRGRISTTPGLNRYLRVTPGGLPRIDKAKIKTEANLDGK